MSEKVADTTQTTSAPVTDLQTTRLNQPAAAAPVSEASSQPNLTAPHKPVAAAASENTATTSHSETLYVIKPGDTLTRIAKTHGTTVKALKAANNLGNDRIVVGAKLKIPEA